MQLLSEKDKKRTSEIDQEIERGDFEKAMELTVGYITENKDKDPFTEAHYHDLASTIIRKKFEHARKSDKSLIGLPMADYTLARKHLDRCVYLYQSLEENARNQLLVANSYCQIAHFAGLAERPEEGWNECQESFRIFSKYRYEEGMKSASRAWYTLRTQKLHFEMMDIIKHFNEDPETNRRRLEAVRKKMEELKKELK
jgi:hypothetical protein